MLCIVNTVRQASVCVLGSANMDLVVTVDRPPMPGETVAGQEFAQIPGGKGANQALAAARAGGDVRMIGAIGADGFGSLIRASLEVDGIDTTGLQVVDQPTGTAHIVVNRSGENSIVVVPGANGSVHTLTEHDRDAITASDVLLLQFELPAAVVGAAARWASEHETRVVLTPAPVRPLSPELLAAIDLLVPNEHEAALLTATQDSRVGADRLISAGVDAVVITMGPNGCLYTDGSQVLKVSAIEVSAVDTTAAGDTFVGALAVALAEGRPVTDSLAWATAASALSVQRQGASTSIPYRHEIDGLVATIAASG